MTTHWETNFTDLQANDFGNLGKNNSGNIFVGNHAVIFTEMNSPRFFFGRQCLCGEWHMPLDPSRSLRFAFSKGEEQHSQAYLGEKKL